MDESPRYLDPRTLASLQGLDLQARSVAGPVLRHRIVTNFNAEAEGLRPDDIVQRLVKAVPVDEHESESGKLPKIFKSANAG